MDHMGDARRRSSVFVGGPVSGMVHRPQLAENVRTASHNSSGSDGSHSGTVKRTDHTHEKPIASGNGVSLSITLAEPVLFLQGFEQCEVANQVTTMLRGSFHLRVSKPAKIKAVSLTFKGSAETEWPEGWSLHKSQVHIKTANEISVPRYSSQKIGV